MRARYYDTDINRFINQDILTGSPLESQSLNRYAYCQGNPVTQSDPFGLCPMLNLNLSERDLMHIGLGIAAMIPGVGAIASGYDAFLYFKEGNYVDGMLSLACCVVSTGKILTTVGKLAKAGKIACALSKTGTAMRAVGSIGVSSIMAVHTIENAANTCKLLVESHGELTIDVLCSGAKTLVCAAGVTGALDEFGNSVDDMKTLIKSGQACFVAGTQVLTDEGLKNIEDIQAGDYVYSTDEETGESGYKEVLNTFAKETEVLTHVSYELKDDFLSEYEEYYLDKESINHNNRDENGYHKESQEQQEDTTTYSKEIVTTMNHRFWCEGSWKTAGTLEEGDILTLADGSEAVVTEVTFEAKHTTVYNMEVADYHTYYVGEDSVWVHNMCDVQPGTSVKTKSSDELTPSGEGGSNQLLLEKTPTRRELAEQKLAEAASGINNKTIDSRTNMEIGRFIGDDRGNVFIEPVGGTTVPAGRNGVDTHTLYPNGSNYNRYNPVGHGNNTTPHGHGHIMGTGPGRRGQGPSIDVLGNVVPFNSPDAHWTIH